MALDWDTLSRTLRPENSPGFLLWQVANQWQRLQRSTLEPLGLTHVQFVLLAGLAWLSRKENDVTQARLAAFCKTDAMMTSQVVRSLEAGGFVARAPHPTDIRARQLRVTAKGAEVLSARCGGPIMLVDLPAGTWHVTAQSNGQSRSKTLSAGAGRSAQATFVWPVENS